MGNVNITLQNQRENRIFYFQRFWNAHERYHLSDMLEILTAILLTFSDKEKEEKEHKKIYLPQVVKYHVSMKQALSTWYKKIGLDFECPFDKDANLVIQFVRYSRNKFLRYDDELEKYGKAQAQSYLKDMKSHLVYIMVETGKFLNLNYDLQDEGYLPPEIKK